MGNRLRADKPSLYVASHLGRLSLLPQYIKRAYTVITLQNQERHKQLDVLQTDRVYAGAVNVQLKQPVIQSN